LSIINFMI